MIVVDSTFLQSTVWSPLWPGNRLLPRAPAVFDAESWPFRVTFEAGPTGEVDRFRLDGPDLARGRLSGVYEKLV